MGRELKRVPLDFSWPLNNVWAGYLNPHHAAKSCPVCKGSGYSKEAKHLHDEWYGYVAFDPISTGSIPFTPETSAIRALAEHNVGRSTDFYGTGDGPIQKEAERLARLFNRSWSHHLHQDDVDALWAEGRLTDFNPNWRDRGNEGLTSPSAAEVNLWSLTGMGHDGIKNAICIREKCKRLGYPLLCANCQGDGELWPSAEAKALYENWQQIEPPTGEGYQLWETVSEGSPISPVFPSKDTFIDYLISQGYSEGAAEQFAEKGFAVSMATANGRLYKDIESLNIAQDED